VIFRHRRCIEPEVAMHELAMLYAFLVFGTLGLLVLGARIGGP
jgi:hypothetical protein